MKNSLMDLHDILFKELETLSDEDLKGDKLDQEIRRSKAVSNISTTIVHNAQVMLDAKKVDLEYGGNVCPEIITREERKQKTVQEIANE